jgi:hypothetical protein
LRFYPFFGSILELVDKRAQSRTPSSVARLPKRPARPAAAGILDKWPGWDLRNLAAAAVFYFVAALILTVPLSLNPSTSGPFGQPEGLENAWGLSWISHQLLTDPFALFDAGVFHPLPRALVFSEHLFVPGLIALPILTFTNDLVLAVNIVLLIAVVSSALGMYLLTVNLTGSRLAATLAGLFYGFIPYRCAQLHLLQLQFNALLPLALLCLDRFLRTGNRYWAWGFGGLLALQALSGSYLAATATVAALFALLTLVPSRSRAGRDVLVLVGAVALAITLVFPFAYLDFENQSTRRTEWNPESVESFSANPATFLASPSRLYRAAGKLWLRDSPKDFLFPGVTLLLLGALGTGVLLARRDRFSHPWSNVSCYGLILVAGVVLSFGPKTPIYVSLYEHIALFRGLEQVTRFGLLMFLSLCVLSGFALAWLFETSVVERRRTQVAALIAAFFLIESTTAPESIDLLRDEPPEVYTWLARQSGNGAIVELPYQARQARRLFWARHYNFRPSLGGVSRFVPKSHQWMEVLLERFPSSDSIALLKKLDVRYVIIHLDSYTPPDLLHLLNGLAHHRYALLPIRDFGTELVFELRRSETTDRHAPDPTHAVTKLATVHATPERADEEPLSPALDSRFEIHLTSMSRVSGLRILYGPNPRTVAERIELHAAEGDGAPKPMRTTPPDWPALTELITGLLDNPLDGAQELRFDPIELTRFQLRLESSEGRPSVSAIEVLGSSSPD